MIRIMTVAAVALALAAPAALAQESAHKGAVNDSLFAQAAESGGLAAVSLSELGVQRAKDPDLRKFSQQMVEEHNRINQQLWTLAAAKRYRLPRTTDARAQFCGQSLAGLSGEEFDRCYAKAQLHMHRDAVAAFEVEAERGQDPQVKAFASQHLSKIKEHLKQIEEIAERFDKEKKD
jgi:putative membrane protein